MEIIWHFKASGVYLWYIYLLIPYEGSLPQAHQKGHICDYELQYMTAYHIGYTAFYIGDGDSNFFGNF